MLELFLKSFGVTFGIVSGMGLGFALLFFLWGLVAYFFEEIL